MSLAPLDQVGWLAEQSEEFRQWAATVALWQTFSSGQVLYLAGDPSSGLYGLASGTVELTFPLLAEEPIALHRARTGFWIGDSAELAEEPRLVTLAAATDCRMLFIPHIAVRSLLAERPQHWQAFYRLSHRNAATAVRLLAETLSLSVRARICRRLLDLTESLIEVELTQDQLAKLLGLARTTVRAELSRLAVEGAIELGYGKLRVADRGILIRHRDEQ